MNVALVHDWLTGMRGGEKVLEELADLWPEAPIYTLLHIPGSISEKLESHPIHTSYLQRAPGVREHYRSYLPFFPSAIEDLDLTGYDLLFSTSHCVAKGAIPGPGAVHLCYCHTPMRYAWDQEHTYFPQRRGLKARLRNLMLSSLRTWDAASAWRVDQFLANSSFVAERIRRYYGRDAEVIPPPVDIDFFMAVQHDRDDNDNEEYCLVISALAPYKRLDLAIAACERLGMELRIVGTGPEKDRLEQLAGDRTRFLGRVDDDELRRLYRGARAYLLPGIEDFGIATVEALACETPVVALSRGGVTDIVDDGVHGVLYSEAGSVDALAGAIDKSRRIRFNKSDLTNRARSFSTARFRERVVSTVSRFFAQPEAARS